MLGVSIDTAVRLAAFEFIRGQTQVFGKRLPRAVLAEGFTFEGQRVPLIGPQGIFKPRILPRYPLTFTTVPPKLNQPAPYEDKLGEDGIIRYRYRGTNPDHSDNAGMRAAGKDRVPLIYLYGLVPGVYEPVWPVYVVADDPKNLTFQVQASATGAVLPQVSEAETEWDRRYATREVQVRLHQAGFRERVLRAYSRRCAICRLKHTELLNAAHILPDGHPDSRPTIPNGIALCTLHHASYDAKILGIRPDYVVEIRRDVLLEHDGPTLQHSIQAVHGEKLHVPVSVDFRPKRDFLEFRYESFRKAG